MNGRFLLLVVVTIAFGALTVKALLEGGLAGILAVPLGSWSGAQIFVDLVIVGLMACVWMVQDAPRQGMRAWPFVALTLLAGSFGPLVYLMVREGRGRAARGR